MEILLSCTWPGNVRQLENAIERACVTAREGVIGVTNLPPDVGGKAPVASDSRIDLATPLTDQLASLTAAFEEKYIRAALKKTRGHVGQCAELTGLSRRSITDKLAQYKIDRNQFKADDDEV